MNEQTVFLYQALDALLELSTNGDGLSPTMKELLKRMSIQDQDIRLLTNMNNFQTVAQNNPAHGINSANYNHTLNSNTANANIRQMTNDALQFIMPSQTMVDTQISSTNGSEISSLYSSRSVSTTQLNNSIINNRSTNNHISNNLNTSSTSISKSSSNQPNNEKFPCDKCQLIFLRDADLKRHAKAHLLLLPNVCSQCGKGFARKDALKRHSGTLSCKRNRRKLMEMAGNNFEEVIKKAQIDGIGI